MRKTYIIPQINTTVAQCEMDLAVQNVSGGDSGIGGGTGGGDPSGGRGKERYDDYDEEEDFLQKMVADDGKWNALW